MILNVRTHLALMLAVAASPLLAQGTTPAFEVASVRAQTARLTFSDIGGNGAWVRPGGVFSVKGVTVQTLITYAYGLEPYQVAGGPDWMRRDTFSIEARAGRDAAEDEIKRMLQSLLRDRFKLVSHTEEQEMRVRVLVLANADGRLGPYLARMGEPCTAADSAEAKKQFPPRVEPSGRGGVMSGSCTEMTDMVRGFNLTASLRAPLAEPPVLNRTGLTGKFTYEMRYVVPDGVESSTARADALEEQLGLKLVADRAVIAVRVIDSVERPTEN